MMVSKLEIYPNLLFIEVISPGYLKPPPNFRQIFVRKLGDSKTLSEICAVLEKS